MQPKEPLSIASRCSELVTQLAALGVERRYRKGAIIISEGDEGGTLFIVKSGGLRAFSASMSNDKEVTYGRYGPGDYVGEMSLDGGARSASVQTTTASICSVVTRDTLMRFIAHHPEFAFELLARVIGRARMATLSVKKLALLDVYGRLIDLLQSLAGLADKNGARSIEERITHLEIASRIGSSREMVSRILKDLERGGYISVNARQIALVKALPAGW